MSKRLKTFMISIRYLIVTFYCWSLVASAQAQSSIYWVKKGNGFWNVAAHWQTNDVPPVNRIPNALDTVFILHDSVIVPNGFNAYARRIELGAEDSSGVGLAVFTGGTLAIDDFGGLPNNPNPGINIINATLFNAGSIQIMDCGPGICIDSSSFLINQDSIKIEFAIIDGIENFNCLENKSGGCILISDLDGLFGPPYGIFNADSIKNDGLIKVTDAGSGIFNSTSTYLENFGTIEISDIQETGINGGELLNLGKIHIDNCNDGISIANSLVNSDTICISNVDYGILISSSSSVLQNLGKIIIRNINMDGILNSGIINNEANGTIHICKSKFVSIDGISNSGGTIENVGHIKIDSLSGSDDEGIHLLSGTFTNFGLLETEKCHNGLRASSTFINLGGTVILANSDLGISGSGLIKNDQNGTFEIKDCDEGIRLLSGAMIENLSGSTIKTINILESPLQIQLGATLYNEGILDIQN